MTTQSAVMGRRDGMAAPSLRRVLGVDAATCVAMGLLLVAAAAPLATLLGLPQPLLTGAGIVLFPCAALMAATAAMRRPAPWLAWGVIAGNAAWVLASIGVLLMFDLTALGIAFVVVQAAVVLGLLVIERRALTAASA
jgi:hypothetical protein